MKPISVITLLLLTFHSFSQTKKDTTTIFYNTNWQETETRFSVYMSRIWKEGSKWHRQDFYYPQSTLQMDGVYADKNLKVKDGVFTRYHKNGMMSDSCLYVASQHEGTEFNWDGEGNQTLLRQWHQDIPVDTAVWWNSTGAITGVQITDSSGNGMYRQYLEDGKTVQVEGGLLEGKRNGTWTFKDENGVLAMRVAYNDDLITSALCYNKKGQLETGEKKCLLEKPASFKGGPDAWDSYLQIHMRYPQEEEKTKPQGIVQIQFDIQNDGSVTNIMTLDAADILLAAEAIRLIKESPKWEPAIQYNRPIVSRHVQYITFAFR